MRSSKIPLFRPRQVTKVQQTYRTSVTLIQQRSVRLEIMSSVETVASFLHHNIRCSRPLLKVAPCSVIIRRLLLLSVTDYRCFSSESCLKVVSMAKCSQMKSKLYGPVSVSKKTKRWEEVMKPRPKMKR